MFNKNKIHLVPQPVLDTAENLMKSFNNETMREVYIDRLETTRDFINDVIQQVEIKKTLDITKKKKVK